MSFRDQSVVTAAGTPENWLLEHFDKKNVCISRYLRAYSCFSQTQPGFHVVLHLLIDSQYFSCWAKCGNTLFIWHCGNPFNWMEKNTLVKWNWCLVAMHTHPNNLPLDAIHGLVLQLLDTEPYSRPGIYFPWPCWDAKTNFPIQPQPPASSPWTIAILCDDYRGQTKRDDCFNSTLWLLRLDWKQHHKEKKGIRQREGTSL